MIFALANAGGVIGYLPLLTLLLPLKVDGIAPDTRIGIVTLASISGAVAAGLSNIAFGWWSDRSIAAGGGRRRFIAGGLAATTAAYALLGFAATPATILLSVIVFQIAVNAVLGPLMATMADEIPDERKGVAGGLLALAVQLASLVSALVIGFATIGEAARLAIVAGAMVACVSPLLLARSRRAPGAIVPPANPEIARRDMIASWIARLLVQIAGTVLFHYLLFYFQTVTRGVAADLLASRTGQLMAIAYVLPLPVAILFGRLSDRSGVRKPFLLAAALIAAGGLAGMATATGWLPAAFAFAVYATGSSTFLALHATFAMQLLPSAAHRGRDLGLLNLSNTIPALLGPALAWALARPDDFSALMLALALLTALGGVSMLSVRGRR